MSEDKNQYQIVRKDARGCFVESLNDAFNISKIHFQFASYDVNKPVGKRQTNNVSIYIAADEFLDLCRKISSGELRYLMQTKKKNQDSTPLYQSMGGTSAESLARYGRTRPDGKSLSRIIKLICADKTDLLLIADSGPGRTDEKGLIVPLFGGKPENHVSVGMKIETFSELMLLTKSHYEAWLCAWYMQKSQHKQDQQSNVKVTFNDNEKMSDENLTDFF